MTYTLSELKICPVEDSFREGTLVKVPIVD